MSDTCYCNTTANMFMLALVSISMNLANIIIINIALPASSIIMGMGIVVSAGVSVRIIRSLG